MRASSRALVTLILVATCACRTAREEQPDRAAALTLADFQALQWLQGGWRGTGGASPFFEGYRLSNDTLLRILYYADSTLTRVSDSGSVYFSDGAIYHEADGAVWRAVAVDSNTIEFEPLARANNSFSWTRESDTAWVATLHFPGSESRVYRLERWPRP